MEKGNLVGIAKGEVIWSVEANALIAKPADADPNETFLTLRDWIDFALYAYETKKDSLLLPLDKNEEALQQEINNAFNQVIRANATITAHLNSIRKVKDAQDETLEVMNLFDIRDNINNLLIDASDKAAAGLKVVRKADETVDNLVDQIN